MVERDEEQAWIALSRQGDPDAFENLVRRYQRMIHSLTFRMTGSLADAEDLAQDAFLQAYQQLGAFRGESKFSSWLYRIAVNTCLNWRKRTQRREQFLQQWSERNPATSHPGAAAVQRVQAALMKLDPRQRAAVVLTFYDGLSHAEAARVLGCAETTVSWRLFAARAKLKRLLKESRPSSAGRQESEGAK
jgi:RNA polymerase sigma-70 factor (ECF subfamily)